MDTPRRGVVRAGELLFGVAGRQGPGARATRGSGGGTAAPPGFPVTGDA